MLAKALYLVVLVGLSQVGLELMAVLRMLLEPELVDLNLGFHNK
jgi:hypothetical protein